MLKKSASKRYKESELELWFSRISKDWESHFKAEEIEYGRALYKACAIRDVELNSSEAFISARLQDGTEPFCIIDFEGEDLIYIPTTSDDFLYGALKVAGLYEIEEFIASRIAEDDLRFYTRSKVEENVEKSPVQEPQEIISENSRELVVNFSSKRKGLVFHVYWKDASKRIPAFGNKAMDVEELSSTESENLMRLITFARKAGFKFCDNFFELDDIPKISLFLKHTLTQWRAYFTVRKDRFVDLLMLGERKISLAAKAKIDSNNAEVFDVDWVPTVDGREISKESISKIFSGRASAQIMPEYGILSISNEDSDFVKSVEIARQSTMANGKIPKYMLLALSEFNFKLLLSDELQIWVDTLFERICDIDFSTMDFLRNYQKKAVAWAINLFKHDCNAMIADEMGLGKTIQTLAIFKALDNADCRFLVVCPASVIPVWVSEAKKFFPSLSTQILTSKTSKLSGKILIASYTQLRRNKAILENQKFEVAVLDEAQFIKNPDSKTTSACMSINAKYKLALTGTPFENRLLDVWTAFRWLMPGLMGNRKRFEELVQNSQEAVKLVRKQISPFVLRRLKSEVARELPEKIFIDLLCPMSDFQKSEYNALLQATKEEIENKKEEDNKKRFTVLSLLTRLRQSCCDARLLPWVAEAESTELGGKISVLLDRVQELLLSGKKVLIFSQFTKFLELIETAISTIVDSEKIYKLTGATRDRSKPVELFQNSKEGVVMLVSLRAGGTGITLTNADYVFLADPWWNPAVEEQAIDRVHRIGRRGDVFVYRLVSQGTVEDRVRQLQTHKKLLFDELLGELKDVSQKDKFIETVKEILY